MYFVLKQPTLQLNHSTAKSICHLPNCKNFQKIREADFKSTSPSEIIGYCLSVYFFKFEIFINIFIICSINSVEIMVTFF
mgnify:CR=1 FL=1